MRVAVGTSRGPGVNVPYERARVPVNGGELAVGRWGTGTPSVFASHGITANHLSFTRVAERVVERSAGAISVVALDHRGRAGSADCGRPFGLETHGDDVVAVMDHLGVDRAVLTGHSMGAFVVAHAAERHPHRVERLVLVDGGVAFPDDGEPVGGAADVEAAVQAVIGPALDRLDMRWESVDAYVDFFRAHPAFRPPKQWSAAVEDYVRHDATTDPDGQVRSSVVKAAVLVDGGAVIVDPERARAIERCTVPTDFLWCPRGLLDEPGGLYPEAYVRDVEARMAHVSAALVVDTNHYTIVTGDAGAEVIATTILG